MAGIKIPTEVKIMDQKYCMNCMFQMEKIIDEKGRIKKFRCPSCGDEEDFEEADEGINC